MGLHIRSEVLPAGQRASIGDAARVGAIGAGIATVVSGVFHHYGFPKLPIGGAWATATLGVGLMAGLATAAVYTANHNGTLHGGARTDSMLGSSLISAGAFAIPGIFIHGRMDLGGHPVNNVKAALGVAAVGLLVGPIIHQFTMPND